jgi:hypothetical protein
MFHINRYHYKIHLKVVSLEIALQIENLLHLLEQFLLSVVFTTHPLVMRHLASRNSLAEGDGVDEVVLENTGVSANAGDVVCIVFLTEVPIFIGDV